MTQLTFFKTSCLTGAANRDILCTLYVVMEIFMFFKDTLKPNFSGVHSENVSGKCVHFSLFFKIN